MFHCLQLIKLAEVGDMRSTREICLEDVSFLLRKDPGKLNRFINRMKFIDSRLHLPSEPTSEESLSLDPEKDFGNLVEKLLANASQLVRRSRNYVLTMIPPASCPF